MDDPLQAGRNWLAVSLLAVLGAAGTALVAVLELGLLAVAVGAVIASLAVVGVAVAIPDLLSAAWAEHRRHVWFATGLFGLGSLFGVALLFAGVDLTDLFLELLAEELGVEDPDDPGEFELDVTATFFVVQNTPPFLASILGALTLGLFTAFVMLLNGVLVGNVAVSVAGDVGFAYILVGVVPHGIFELPALFVAAGVGFRLVQRFVQRVRGTRESAVTKAYLKRTAALVLFAWLLLVVAAFVEAYLTIALLEMLFGA